VPHVPFAALGALAVIVLAGPSAFAQPTPPPELRYAGELIAYPGPWAFQLGKPNLVLVNDQQLDDLTDPDKPVNLSLTGEPRVESLRQLCERSRAAGHRTVILAHDHFFSQYRQPGGTTPRAFLPDTDAAIERIAKISRFAAEYGIGLELSLLSPLEIGPGFRKATGESGQWMHYRKGLRDPTSGAYSVALWRQRCWTNNKGSIPLEDAGVRVFAFRERDLRGTPHKVVDPAEIVEITDTAQAEVFEGLVHKAGTFEAVRVRVHGSGRADLAGFNRVLVVQQYRTPELDYFSPQALPFLTGLVDRYVDAGVKLHGLYSDEMHIQQDWHYFSHHDHGQFAVRYVTPTLAARFAELHGEQYRDFAKWLVYFTYGQEDFVGDLGATAGAGHVLGETPEAVADTALLRARYYRLLQDTVVDLFTAAKHHAEARVGHRLEARAHATWAQSPTIDRWDTLGEPHQRHQYEYTSNFVWSNTVQQAASACHDYFKWGDFLTGNGNDHAEGGWLDRNYYGLALAASLGVVNELPYAYGAHWGMPQELYRRRQAVADAYGVGSSTVHGLVQDMQHRDVDVLMLYPLNLVASEERFGSWMTQYGYANLITQEKLAALGEVRDGAIHLAGRKFTTLAALFEPFPSERLLAMMRELVAQGGRVVWSGQPPVRTWEGGDARGPWQDLMGADFAPRIDGGLVVPGKTVAFEGALGNVPPQAVLTHFLVDRAHPLVPRAESTVAARLMNDVVGVQRTHPGGGRTLALGMRPRDDQSASLGQDVATWFHVLRALGAYAPTGAFPDHNDQTEHLSRTGPHLACRFPNGAISIAPHLRSVVEEWPGGFARDAAADNAYLARVPPPSERLDLADFRVNGRRVTYAGDGTVSFRAAADGRLEAFAGRNTTGITIDGVETRLADQPLGQIAFGPVPAGRRVEGGAVFLILAQGAGTVRVPAGGLPPRVALWVEGSTPGSRGAKVASRREGDALVFESGDSQGRWVYVVAEP
jgi:hypothetical protein